MVVNGDGFLEPGGASPASGGASPAPDQASRNGRPEPFPVAVRAASIQPVPGGAILAVNRKGLLSLTVARYDGGAETRLLIEPLPGATSEFRGRSAAQSWGRGQEALFLLYRHPVYELEPPRSPLSVVVAATLGEARLLEPGLGEDAYAVFPVSADSWLVQSRSETADRVTTSYARVPSGGGAPERLERSAFERLASPEPLAAAPEGLRAAAAALTGPLLIEAKLADGSRRAYVRGDPGQAAPAWAQVSGEVSAAGSGPFACVVTDDWRLAVARPSATKFSASVFNLSAPSPGTAARDAALVGGLVVISWEEDLFPDVGSSGILALDPSL
jgi:hypothetical protein